MVLAGYDYNWRKCPIIRANGLNDRNPFSIALLELFRFFTFFGACYDHIGGNFAHYKPNFVEIVDIRIRDAIFRDNIRNKAKLITDDIWIFA
jgi:hypothetical protein